MVYMRWKPSTLLQNFILSQGRPWDTSVVAFRLIAFRLISFCLIAPPTEIELGLELELGLGLG